MNGEDRSAAVRQLVESLLTAAGVPFQPMGGCLAAQLSDEAMSALEGRWAPAASLLLAFDPESAAATPGADLVVQGSFRFERFLAWIRREVKLSRAWLPAWPRGTGRGLLSDRLTAGARQGLFSGAFYPLDESQVWEPYLVLALLAARVGEVRRETLHVPAFNLTAGCLVPDFRPHLPERAGAPSGREARRRHPYRRAYEALLGSVVDEVRREDASWAESSLRHYREEVSRLESFYAELAREHRGEPETLAQLSAALERRIREQNDRFRPRVLVRPLAAALVHVPAVHHTVLFADGLCDRRRTFTYDPILAEFRPDAAGPPPEPGRKLQRPPTPPPEPGRLLPPVGGRWPL